MEESKKGCYIAVLLSFVLRWIVSIFPYSGMGKPPMYGDYEAQRHWQEITVNLKYSDWYRDTKENDLQYWGLDYPPLTAYHSFLCGLIALYINPNYVALDYSRGFESPDHKLFMRYTVLIVDIIVYFPAAVYFLRNCHFRFISRQGIFACFSALILYPGIYLIDYGHFQYNNFSLGLFIAAVALIFSDSDLLSAFFFSLSLNYKQMELYHALPFFCYLLGKSFQLNSKLRGFIKVILLGFVVVGTFLLCWAPFLTDLQLFQSVISRLFPINRGIYEDKVASFWCSLSVLFKVKNMFDHSMMAIICLVTTFLSVVPSCLHLLINAKPNVFKYTLINVSFLFFLFSFHVHEKSILLVAIPTCFVFNEEPLIVTWFFIISLLSMFPLLIKDGLIVPAISLTVLIYFFYLFSPKNETSRFSFSRTKFCQYVFRLSLFGYFLIISSFFSFSPPEKYPDLYSVMISSFSCFHFGLFCLYFHYCQFSIVNFDAIKTKRS